MRSDVRETPEKVNDFVLRIINDNRLSTVQMSLLFCLLHKAMFGRSHLRFFVDRKTLMKCAKIMSITTYHISIKLLNDSGYIAYRPSFHPARQSEIELLF